VVIRLVLKWRSTDCPEPSSAAVGDKKTCEKTLESPSMPFDRTNQKPNRKTLLIVVWAFLLLFTLFSGSIAG